MSYKSVWDFGRSGGITNYSVHSIGEYPSKIRPLVFHEIVKRFSKKGDIVLDPFCGCGTMAVECKILGRHSINYDINENAINLTKEKLKRLNQKEIINTYEYFIKELKKEKKNEKTTKLRKVQIDKEMKKYEKMREDALSFNTKHIVRIKDAREHDYLDDIKKIDSKKIFVDSIITDIPYASMIKYSNLDNDLSTIEDYDLFLEELSKISSPLLSKIFFTLLKLNKILLSSLSITLKNKPLCEISISFITTSINSTFSLFSSKIITPFFSLSLFFLSIINNLYPSKFLPSNFSPNKKLCKLYNIFIIFLFLLS